jgi:protein-L-isoaspartate O-methyltransferase
MTDRLAKDSAALPELAWEPHAGRLAEAVTRPVSRWRPVIATTPRHPFIHAWWETTARMDGDGTAEWTRCDGPADPERWLQTAYRNRSPITQVGGVHADLADQATVRGRPTSSATMPLLLVLLYRHAELTDTSIVLDVGTGSGYGTALLARRLGDRQVASTDVDPYLTAAASERLASLDLFPTVVAGDAAGELPASHASDGRYDRIVATVGMRGIPASWLAALRPGGRLVAPVAGTGMIIGADRTADGGAVGQVETTRAGFMPTRPDASDYPARLLDGPGWADIQTREGEQVTSSPFPVLDVADLREILTMLELASPGIQHHYARDEAAGTATAVMLHADGSWARATTDARGSTTVHQGGPRRLWGDLERIRHDWLRDGYLPVYDARVRIDPDGICQLRLGRWRATIPALG